MKGEKKLTNKEIKNAELTDEQANAAAGGSGRYSFKCDGGCGGFFWGSAPYSINGKPCCASCYEKYQQSQQQGRPDRHGRR